MTTSLHDYASRGKLEKIIDKVAKGRNLNRQEPSYGNTTLIVAAGCGYVDVVNWCIEQKAELNVQENSGRTALHLAALKGHAEIAKSLVAGGIDASIKDKEGWTAKELASTKTPDWVPSDDEAVAGRAAIAEMLK